MKRLRMGKRGESERSIGKREDECEEAENESESEKSIGKREERGRE
jgi:hypothetical protein